MRLWIKSTNVGKVGGCFNNPYEIKSVEKVLRDGGKFQKHLDDELEKQKESDRIRNEEEEKLKIPEKQTLYSPLGLFEMETKKEK